MAGNTNSQYLESKVFTASQPRLHLMLLDGVVRQCAVAQQAGAQEFWGEFDAAVGKAMDIVEELTRSVAAKSNTLVESLEEQYAFIYRELTAARFDMSLNRLGGCAKLLEYHRDTWKQVCDKSDITVPGRPPVVGPHLNTGPAVESFLFEA